MRVGSLFAGVGGFDRGLERVGFEIAWQVERDPFCQRVLAARWPHVARGTDVREWTGDGSEPVDLLCGGFPCQDLSVAGQRAGLAGARSGLFWQIVRFAKQAKPTWGLFENVPGLFSSHGGRDLAAILEGLRQCWPVVGYRVLDSRYWGVAQRRRRVFLVGGPTEAGVEQVLFEPESGGGGLAACAETRQDIAASLRSRSSKSGVNLPGRGGEDDMNLQIVQSLTNLGSGGPDDNEAQAGHLVTHTLRADGYDASEDGTGRGTPIIPIAEVGAKTQMGGGRNGCGIGHEGDPMFTLQAGKQHAVGVRRITPTEAERLQGFPDLWTCLCGASVGRDWSLARLSDATINACTCPDSARYRALGNAVTVPVIEWIGQRLMAAMVTAR